MVRRGMDMLVGGVPISADPPQRYMDLLYDINSEWYAAITTNARDFGPILNANNVKLLSNAERGLFCEHFVHSTLKWDVCPSDLKEIVKGQSADTDDPSENDKIDFASGNNNVQSNVTIEGDNLMQSLQDIERDAFDKEDKTPKEKEAHVAVEKSKLGNERSPPSSGRGFGKVEQRSNQNKRKQKNVGDPQVFVFKRESSIQVTKEELETGKDGKPDPSIFTRVITNGIKQLIGSSDNSLSWSWAGNLVKLVDMEDGATNVELRIGFLFHDKFEQQSKQLESILPKAIENGDFQLAIAAAAREETGWPEDVRDRVVEECLFDDDDGDGPLFDDSVNEDTRKRLLDYESKVRDEYDGPFGMPGSTIYPIDDIFLGEGNDGVFWDYSEKSLSKAPYNGDLGLRLVDAVTQKAKERHPRIIAIGDVHGCIDELQDLLRQCDYRPGDQVLFLGDLVSKGPDSISVVQMAREIGAIGVRGNHDFEVIRWYQAIKSGVDPPVVGSEHFHIASCLSKADMKWMYSLPWYISSKELKALFVHAGFVSGIRLGKQNPRLMMNMRSILPDGTVTSKFFNNWPWARLWDGPQTVLFGHDADRGLQQYEHAIGLDTGCVYGGRLTACILPEKRLVSVSARKEYFKYRRKHYD